MPVPNIGGWSVEVTAFRIPFLTTPDHDEFGPKSKRAFVVVEVVNSQTRDMGTP